jgi:hypothetical protein
VASPANSAAKVNQAAPALPGGEGGESSVRERQFTFEAAGIGYVALKLFSARMDWV